MNYFFIGIIILLITENSLMAETVDNKCQNVFFSNCTCGLETSLSVQCHVTNTTTIQIQFGDDPAKKVADLRDYSVFTNETYKLPEKLLKTANPIQMSIMLSGLDPLDADVCNYQLAYLNVDNAKSLKTLDPNFWQECSALLMFRLSRSEIREIVINRNNNICKLRNLILVNNKIQTISNELMQWCTQLMNVDLSGNEISHLPSQFFSTCSSLLTLSLSNNLISGLEPQIFSRCDKLDDLDLSKNSIQDLNDVFTKTESNIRFLNLEDNQIQRLPNKVLSSLMNLEELNVNSNNITFVADEIFGACDKLRLFQLKSNNLSTFPINSIENCSTIFYLDLGNNQIKSLPDHSLPASLKTLDLSNNKLETLSSNLLKNSLNLANLFLSGNKLINVPFNLLESPYMKNIDLSGNQLTSIPPSANESCLSSFDISENQIEFIDLSSNPSITYNISHNKISVVISGILRKDCFTTILDASYNQLKELKPKWNFGLQNLLFLDLSFNFLEQLSSKDLFLLTNLKYLNLSNNKLAYIEDGIFNSMQQLVNLNLNNNPIHIYEANFFPVSIIDKNNVMCPDPANLIQSLNNLIDVFEKNYSCQRPINCKCQLIKSILSDFMCNYASNIKVLCESHDCPDQCFCVNVEGSTYVDCDNANISLIPRSLSINTSVVYLENNQLLSRNVNFDQSWKQVVYVYMKSSIIGSENNLIGHPFTNLGKTKRLDLSQNNISSISSGVFKGLEELNFLNLSGNQLTDLPSGLFVDVINLDVLDLSNNKLTSINPNNFMSEITRLQHLILKNNQITGKSSFVELPSALISLDLMQNLISSTEFLFPRTNSLPTNLTVVNLRFNKLNEINISIQDLGDNFIRLDLQNNDIEKININTNKEEEKKGILQLFVRDNKILCDCDLKNITKYINSRNSSFKVLIDDAKCDKPIFLKDKNIVSLESEDLLCTENINCGDSCNCYKNQSTDVILMDCTDEKKEILSLPTVAPTGIHSLYVRNLNLVHNNLTEDSWNSLKEFYLVDRGGFKAGFVALKNISRIQKVELDDDCWCRVRDYVAFSLESTSGSCDQSLPASHCIRNPTNNKTWSRIECTSSFTPQLTFAKIPVCPVYENCDECSCYLDSSLSLVMNCSGKQMTQFPDRKPVDVNILDMNNNFLTVLPDFGESWSHLVELYVQNNFINKIVGTNLPRTLKLVVLDNNSLRVPSGWLDEIMQTKGIVKTRLSLMGNPLQCDCEKPNFSQWPLDRFSALVIKANQTSCFKENNERHLLIQTLQCKTSKVAYIVVGILLLSILAIIAILLALYFKYRRSIHVYLLAHDLCLCLLKEETFDVGKEYEFDAFISYSSEDSDVIVDVLLPGLEKLDFKACVHERDWLGGEFISEQIVKSVQTSRRTIIVLSEAFLKSPWATMEFKVALQQALEDRVNRIIVVVPGDTLPDKEQMFVDLRSFVTMNTYLFINDPRFWDKLRFAMPHKTNKGKAPLRKLPLEFVEMMRKRKVSKKKQESTKSSGSASTVCTTLTDIVETDLNDEIV